MLYVGKTSSKQRIFINIGSLLPYLEQYRDGEISNSEFNALWDGPANRQET